MYATGVHALGEENMSVSVAVLGCGRIGQVHGRAIASSQDARLIAVADPFPKAANSMAELHGTEVRSIEQIASAGDIDAVIICTPTDTHADLIEKFVDRGKDVFCEKPIDLDATRVRQCLSKVEASGQTLMVGFNRRFDPHFQAMKARIDAGDIGKVEMVSITSRDPGLPPASYIERSGGIFRDMTIHDFDVARWLLGEEIDTVVAMGSVLVDSDISDLGDFDSASVMMKTKSGRQAAISNSRRATYGYDQRIEVHGSEGTITAQNLREHQIELATKNGFSRPPLMDFFMDRYALAYSAEIEAFARSVQEKTAPPTTGMDGLKALLLADAANLSIAESRVVSLAELDG